MAAQLAEIDDEEYGVKRINRNSNLDSFFGGMMAKITFSIAQLTGLEFFYQKNESDEFIVPTVISSYSGISNGDGLMCINFRSDRARQIMSALGNPSFKQFNVSNRPKWEKIISMTKYSDEHNRFVSHLFSTEPIKNTLGSWVHKWIEK